MWTHPEAFYGGCGLWLTMTRNILTGGLEHLWTKIKDWLESWIATWKQDELGAGLLKTKSQCSFEVKERDEERSVGSMLKTIRQIFYLNEPHGCIVAVLKDVGLGAGQLVVKNKSGATIADVFVLYASFVTGADPVETEWIDAQVKCYGSNRSTGIASEEECMFPSYQTLAPTALILW